LKPAETRLPGDLLGLVSAATRPHFRGSVQSVTGVLVEAEGLPAGVGELCSIRRSREELIDAEVVGFRDGRTLLMPHGELDGIAPGQPVIALGHPFSAPVGRELLGRVLDGLGRPIDGLGRVQTSEQRMVRSAPPAALSRAPIVRPLVTGVRSIDGLCTLGRGQRLGIFAGAGVGKSTLLGQIARGCEADAVVIALVGERGREVKSFLEEALGPEHRHKAITFVATSDRPPIERYLAPFVAVTAAEALRDQGLDVLLVMDSVTRFAMACREVGLAAGEPPTVRGYPPSFFATMPKLIERLGNGARGSITGLLTVLLDGDDPQEPVADALRGLLDGHVELSRDLANSGHFPAVDVLASLSRLMRSVTDPHHQQVARRVREDLAAWNAGKDLIEIGAYRPGANPALDRAVERMPLYDAVLRQEPEAPSSFEETVALLEAAAGGLDG
jgi:flagellum-specific ATP synthase